MSRIVLLVPILAAGILAQVPPGSPELKQAATETRVPALRELFEEFTTPHDRVHLRERAQFIRVAPLVSVGTGGQAKLVGTLKLVPLDAGEQPEALAKFPANDVLSHRSYEWLALEALDKLKTREDLPGQESLGAAERVLAAVLQFHESERQNGVRKGVDWSPLRERVRERLLSVRLEQLQARTAALEWDQAIGLSRRLLETDADPGRPALPGLDRALGVLVEKLQADPKLSDDRRLALLEQFSKIVQPPRLHKAAGLAIESLKKLARAALQQANAANESKPPDPARAQEFIARTEKLWPGLPELGGFALRVERSDSVLRVGVRELPEYLSPARAVTDNEQRIVEMLFQSLMRPRRDENGLLFYAPSLAESRPPVIPQGRRFLLARNAAWSDGKPVLPADVRHTLTLIRDGKAGPDSRRWSDLLDDAIVGGEARQVDVLFRRGWLDPLSPTTFKVVPTEGDAGSEAFGRQPVGSGPFAFAERKVEAGRPTLILKANPHFGRRPGMTGLPTIRAIHFVVSPDPVEDFARNLIDLALDVTPEQVASWRARQKDATEKGAPQLLERLKLSIPASTWTPNRRVYYLAVNHTRQGLKTAEVRDALARSIDRTELLKTLGGGQPMVGMYPHGTWAASANRTDKLHDPEPAGARLRKDVPAGTTWKVKIPSGSAPLRQVFDIWTRDVEKHTEGKVKLEVVEVPARQLHADVESGQFDLAYAWYDYPDDTFWLGPLLLPYGQGLKRPFGYQNAEVERLLQEARDHRDFRQVSLTTTALAKKLDVEMPVIPLWQVEPRHLLHERVKVTEFDPVRVFGNIERWTLF